MGPGASIFLANKLDQEEQKLFKDIVETFVSSHPEVNLDIDEVDLTNEESEYSIDELEHIGQLAGAVPTYEICISAGTNSPQSHRGLADIVRQVALALNGMINFSGAIYPIEDLPKEIRNELWKTTDWTDVKPYFDKMIKPISGQIFTVEYELSEDRTWAYHLCDHEFLTNWMDSPYFKMIK